MNESFLSTALTWSGLGDAHVRILRRTHRGVCSKGTSCWTIVEFTNLHAIFTHILHREFMAWRNLRCRVYISRTVSLFHAIVGRALLARRGMSRELFEKTPLRHASIT